MKGQHDPQDHDLGEARISRHSRCTFALAGDTAILYRIRLHDGERCIRCVHACALRSACVCRLWVWERSRSVCCVTSVWGCSARQDMILRVNREKAGVLFQIAIAQKFPQHTPMHGHPPMFVMR
jgi:hypothetical protein